MHNTESNTVELNSNTLVEHSMGMVQTWFPKLVYFKDGLHMDRLDEWSDVVREQLKDEKDVYLDHLPVKSNHMQANMFQIEELRPLWDTVLEHANWFAGMMGYIGLDVIPSNAWANISRQGDFLFPHRHPSSLISGAFYLKASRTDQILFMDDESVMLQPNFPTSMTYNKVTYDCLPGRLLLFKSDTLHGVTRQESPEEKIVISFNLVGTVK